MILFCDENISPRVADALKEAGYDARSFRDLGWLGVLDEGWLPRVGQEPDAVVLTGDRQLFQSAKERDAIVANAVGVVALTSGNLTAENAIRLLLDAAAEIEHISDTTSRPFIRFLTPEGKILSEWNGVIL